MDYIPPLRFFQPNSGQIAELLATGNAVLTYGEEKDSIPGVYAESDPNGATPVPDTHEPGQATETDKIDGHGEGNLPKPLTYLTDPANLVVELDAKGEPVLTPDGVPVRKPRLDERKWKQLMAIQTTYENDMRLAKMTRAMNENVSRRWEARQLRVDLARQLQIEIQLIEGLRGKLDTLNQQVQLRKKRTEEMLEAQQRESELFRERFRTLQLRNEESEAKCREYIAELGAHNEAVKEFRAQKAQLAAKLQDYQAQLVRENQELEARLNRAAHKHKLEKNGLKYALIQSIHRAKTKLVTSTYEQLHPTTRRLIQENLAAGAELQFQSAAVARLRKRAWKESALCVKLSHSLAILRAEKNRNAARLRLLRELVANLQAKTTELDTKIRRAFEEATSIENFSVKSMLATQKAKADTTRFALPDICSRHHIPASGPSTSRWGSAAQNASVPVRQTSSGNPSKLGEEYTSLSVRGLESRLDQLQLQLRHAYAESLAAADEVANAIRLRNAALQHLDPSARFILQCLSHACRLVRQAKLRSAEKANTAIKRKLAAGDLAGAMGSLEARKNSGNLEVDKVIPKQATTYVQDFLISTVQQFEPTKPSASSPHPSQSSEDSDIQPLQGVASPIAGATGQVGSDASWDSNPKDSWRAIAQTPEERLQILDLWFLLMSSASTFGVASASLVAGFEPLDVENMHVPANTQRPGRPISASDLRNTASSDQDSANAIKPIPISAVMTTPEVDPRLQHRLLELTTKLASGQEADKAASSSSHPHGSSLSTSLSADMPDSGDIDELSRLVEQLKDLGVLGNAVDTSSTASASAAARDETPFKFDHFPSESKSLLDPAREMSATALVELAHRHALLKEAAAYADELRRRARGIEESFGEGGNEVLATDEVHSPRPTTPRVPGQSQGGLMGANARSTDTAAEAVRFGTGAPTSSGELRSLPTAYLLSIMEQLESPNPGHARTSTARAGGPPTTDAFKRFDQVSGSERSAAGSNKSSRGRKHRAHEDTFEDEDESEDYNEVEEDEEAEGDSSEADEPEDSEDTDDGGVRKTRRVAFRRRRERDAKLITQLKIQRIVPEDESEEVEEELDGAELEIVAQDTGSVQPPAPGAISVPSAPRESASKTVQKVEREMQQFRIASLERQIETQLESRKAEFDLSLAMDTPQEDLVGVTPNPAQRAEAPSPVPAPPMASSSTASPAAIAIASPSQTPAPSRAGSRVGFQPTSASRPGSRGVPAQSPLRAASPVPSVPRGPGSPLPNLDLSPTPTPPPPSVVTKVAEVQPNGNT